MLQDDPIKQVIVIRKDLQMRLGKSVAQGSHASMSWTAEIIRQLFSDNEDVVQRAIETGTSIAVTSNLVSLTAEQLAWIFGRFTKICLYVESEAELDDIHHSALEAGLDSRIIVDSGVTEFRGVPTKTCLAIGPHYASKIDPITGHLKLL